MEDLSHEQNQKRINGNIERAPQRVLVERWLFNAFKLISKNRITQPCFVFQVVDDMKPYDEHTTRTSQRSTNSIDYSDEPGDADHAGDADNSLSDNECGYLSDVSNSASPPPGVTPHYKRRSKFPDANPLSKNTGSVSDTDDDSSRLRQFERKPPRGKSSRRRSRQPTTDDEPKTECYNGSRKRFSWTDSGVSSSMGTGPHTKRLSVGDKGVYSIHHDFSVPENKFILLFFPKVAGFLEYITDCTIALKT